jgi:murein DD-endopeptidase MepM/ murein hydrolase activator NlpD
MSDNKHTGRGWNGKGYYIALVLCAAAIGITSYVYNQNSDLQEEVLLEESQIIPVGTMTTEEDIPVLATEPRNQTIPSESGQTEATHPSTPKKRKIVAPVAGQEIYGYSMEALSYNQTTRDWRVHNGIDLAAEEGTPVCAACDGTVYTAGKDDTMGYTVEIRHEGGYTTVYSCLQENLTVGAGDTVEAGQIIGYAGSTALVETTLGSHVHFSVSHQNNPMEPMEFLSMGE